MNRVARSRSRSHFNPLCYVYSIFNRDNKKCDSEQCRGLLEINSWKPESKQLLSSVYCNLDDFEFLQSLLIHNDSTTKEDSEEAMKAILIKRYKLHQVNN